jgi:hypothetical protein
MAESSWFPNRTYIIHHGTDELLVEQHTVSDGQAASPVKEGTKDAQFWAAFFHTWLTYADQVSCVSRVTSSYRALSTHCIGSPRNWTGLGFWMRLAVSTESTAVLFETLMAILQSRSHCSSVPR